MAKYSESTSKKDEMANGSPGRHCVTHSSSSGPIFEEEGMGFFLDKVTQTDQYRQLKASCLVYPEYDEI